MVCPHCGTSMTVGSSCPACGRAAPTPPADQFGSPMPSGLTGYAPPPTSAQLYPEQPAPVPADPTPWAAPPPGSPYGGYWGPPAQQAGNGFSIAGIVLGVIALVFCPVVFGVVGIVMAVQGRKRGESLSKVALGVSIGGLVGGILLTVVLMATTSFYDVSFS